MSYLFFLIVATLASSSLHFTGHGDAIFLYLNPALIKEEPSFSLELPSYVGPAGSFPSRNSAFTVRELFKYFYSGRYLDEQDKEFILEKTSPLWKIETELIGFLALKYRRTVLGVRVMGGANFKIQSSMMELLLYGNELGVQYSLDGLEYKSALLGSFDIGFGFNMENVDCGFGLHFYYGYKLFELIEAEGILYTDSQSVSADAILKVMERGDGYGVGFDVGFSGFELPFGFDISLSLMDISPGIFWGDRGTIHYFTMSLDSTNFLAMKEVGDSALYDTVFSETERSFKWTPAPTRFSFGIQRGFGGYLFIRFGLDRWLTNCCFEEPSTILHCNLETLWPSFLKLYVGVGYKLKDSVFFEGGAGIKVFGIHFDVGYEGIDGVFWNSRGGRLFVGWGFSF